MNTLNIMITKLKRNIRKRNDIYHYKGQKYPLLLFYKQSKLNSIFSLSDVLIKLQQLVRIKPL